mgnify:CR=1 FL=1
MVMYRLAQPFDYERARIALEKMDRGETPNTRETASLKRVEEYYTKRVLEDVLTDFNKTLFFQKVRTSPQKGYKVAERLGMPLSAGENLDLYRLLLWLFDTAKSGKLDPPKDVADAADDALERQRLLRGDLLKLQLQTQRGELVSAGDVKNLFSIIGNLIRECGERLEKNFGEGPAEALLDTLDDIVSTSAAFFEEIDQKAQQMEEEAGSEGLDEHAEVDTEQDTE